MKLHVSNLAVILLGLTCIAAVGLCSEGLVLVQDVIEGSGQFLSVYGGGYLGTEFHAGVYMLNKAAGTGMASIWPNGYVPAFCVELSQLAPESPTVYEVSHTQDSYDYLLGQYIGTAKAAYLEELWGRYYNPAWAGTGPFTPAQNTAAAAFAAAVWEIVHEDLPINPLGWDVLNDGTTGIRGFRADGVNSVLANSWLYSLDGTGPRMPLMVWTSSTNQNYLVAVPEPGTLALLGLGGTLGLARGHIRVRRRNQPRKARNHTDVV